MMIWIKMMFIIIFAIVFLQKNILASDSLCNIDIKPSESIREKTINV
jgi:hypothetical protein